MSFTQPTQSRVLRALSGGRWSVWIVSVSSVWPVLVEASKLIGFVQQAEGVAGLIVGAGRLML